MRKPHALVLFLMLPLGLTVPARAEGSGGGSVGDFLLGTVEGAMLLALLLTIVFMAGYIAWRRRKKK